ncbi:hypothetical protein DMB92_05780 [Campylobacter sp. MIT 99-7217]|uniref:ClbS/DfsB family four-helix bundle protein n=1 Tax=Campylobacter sp. MIT 99-7217 TaxID=535091 RepID=UPI001158AFD9|nr:ClbS/DfsB family four-helix bundle protein [Campylobacter sp. MIT 99-7217]TQR31889.1 hypothetical protein DMB92_05780 [Campylobacter sp. MIT 99-7217]
MPRPSNKTELIEASTLEYNKLMSFIDKLDKNTQISPFTYPNAKNVRDKNIRDVLIHLHEWHNLLLNFVKNNLAQTSQNTPFFPEGYNWRTYAKLNLVFHEKHQNTSLDLSKRLLEQSHKAVLAMLELINEDELFSKGTFKWCKGTALGSYFISSLSSHYIWALKSIKTGFKPPKFASKSKA